MKQTFNNRQTTKRQLSTGKKILLWMIMIPLFFIMLFAIIGMLTIKDKPTSSNNNQTATMPKKLLGIGQTVSDADFNFVVNSIKCGETRIQTNGIVYSYSDAQGQFCRLNITITNTGDSVNSIGVGAQYVFNVKGQKYDSDSGATATAANAIAGSPLNAEVNPGNSVTGDIVYDLPKDTTPITAELHGDYGSAGARINLQ